MTKRVKVLIVDDSVVVRKVLTEVLSADEEIEVVGAAEDPYQAREMIKQLAPDVLTLDIEMPKMDGITFLRNLMRLRPIPVVMLSTLTKEGADVTLEALELGAVDFIAKPTASVAEGISKFANILIEKVKTAASSKAGVQRLHAMKRTEKVRLEPVVGYTSNRSQLIAIGASTGGTEAIRDVLQTLPAEIPAIVITQHIPPAFSQRFANRLNLHCAMEVCEAQDGMRIEPGHAYVAPGDQHLRVIRDTRGFVCQLDNSEPVNRHKPSVDVMFDSIVALGRCKEVTAVLLTGMGSDGARGMKSIREAGGHTIAQDEQTSLVWGMPGSAVKIDAAEKVLALQKISSAILSRVSG